MPSNNPFPESPEKSHLRLIHLSSLIYRKKAINRDLNYFGLPSAEMIDVRLWKPVLGHVTAVERDEDLARIMYRNAQKMGIRPKFILIEGTLLEATKLLALEEVNVSLFLDRLSLSDQ